MDKIAEIDQKYFEQLQNALEEYGDNPEILHSWADGILTDALKELGLDKIVEKYNRMSINFWYA